MVAHGDADALVSGVNMHYPETIRPALQVIGVHPKAEVVSGLYMLVFEKHVIFCGDTTVNIDPTAEQLAQIAYSAGRIVRTFGITPRIAMLSFSNFGSVRHPEAEKVARAVQLLRQRDPSMVVDGEMQADTALDEELLKSAYPFSMLSGTRERPDLSEPERGQHRVQAAESPWRRDGDRADTCRDEPSGACARARRGRAGHREHGRSRRDGRAVARIGQRARDGD